MAVDVVADVVIDRRAVESPDTDRRSFIAAAVRPAIQKDMARLNAMPKNS